MKTRILLMGLLLAAVADAQTVYHDASAFPLLGKATESTLPAMSVCRTLCRTSPASLCGTWAATVPDLPCASVPTLQAFPPNGK